MMSRTRPVIVHLAVDYNTPYRAPTTHAIEWFIDRLDDFDNVVVALRRSARLRIAPVKESAGRNGRLFDMPYFGLPFGLDLHRSMRKSARQIIALLEKQDIKPDLVHAHKLTFEGLAGWYVARHFDVPLFVSLRGEVETKVFRYKPSLGNLLGKIAAYATRLYFVSAWFEAEFARRAPGHTAKQKRLPNIVRNIGPVIDVKPAGDRFVAVLNLDTRKRKGLKWLLDGVAMAAKADSSVRLEIVGGGSSKSFSAVRRMIAARGLGDVVHLGGRLDNETLIARMPHYLGLVLPSLNETFGMVYVEALFAGIPIIYTAGTGIDGYLDGLDVGIAVPPRDATSIKAAMLTVMSSSQEMRANISAAAPTLFAIFDPGASVAAYCQDVTDAIDAHTPTRLT
jgi:glycosyltransferase involved in cell wall biosynthesis